MRFASMTELNQNYESREMLDYDQEMSYVEDCFDTLEALGFRDVYDSPYQEYEAYVGKQFEVVGRLSCADDDVDLECLPMWNIRFEDGTVIEAYPEEICLADVA